jgi:hypothetical protein
VICLPVLPDREVRAWPTDDGTEPPRVKYLPIGRALTEPYRTDAHVQAAALPSHPYRIKKETARREPVSMVAVIYDVDAHDIPVSERDTWWIDQQEAIDRLLSTQPGLFVYRTRGGYRIVGLLAEPFVIRTEEDETAWTVFYERNCLHLARYGIIADLGCSDFPHLYRLPRATRDGSKPEDLETIGDANAIGVWTHVPGNDCLAADLEMAERLHAAFDAAHPAVEGQERPRNPYVRILRALRPAAPAVPVATQPIEYQGRETRRAQVALEREAEAIARAPVGTRNPALNAAAYGLGKYVASGELDRGSIEAALYNASERNGSVKDYGERAVQRTIKSGLDAGEKNLPRVPPRIGQKVPVTVAETPPDMPDDDEREPEPVEQPTADEPLRGLEHLAPLATFGRDRLLSLAAEPVSYVWQNIAVASTIVLIAGPRSEGKTTLLFLVALARANAGESIPLLGYQVEPAPAGQYIVLIEGEHGAPSAARKLVRTMRILGVDDSALDRVIVVARKAVTLGSPAWRDVVRMVQAGIVSDIAIDTLARVAPGNADSEQEQVALFDTVAQAIDAAPSESTKPTVWAVAHTRKTMTGGLDDVSGSTQRTGQADTVLMIKGEKVGGQTVSTKVTFEKLREEPEQYPAPVSYSIKGERLEYESDSADAALPLEDRILSLLRVSPRTKRALRDKLGRSDKDMEEAISHLFASRQIESTTIKVRGVDRKAFTVRSDMGLSRDSSFSTRSRDEHGTEYREIEESA